MNPKWKKARYFKSLPEEVLELLVAIAKWGPLHQISPNLRVKPVILIKFPGDLGAQSYILPGRRLSYKYTYSFGFLHEYIK